MICTHIRIVTNSNSKFVQLRPAGRSSSLACRVRQCADRSDHKKSNKYDDEIAQAHHVEGSKCEARGWWS